MTFVTFKLNAQIVKTATDTAKIYTNISQSPQFPGGFDMFDNYADQTIVKRLKANYKYGIVVAEILIEKSGKISKVKILQGLTNETDSTAIYLLKNSPLWKPAYNNEQPVRALIKIGIKFRDPMFARIVRVKDVQLSGKGNEDITIDDPSTTKAQNNVDPNMVYTSVETLPEYPGGPIKFQEYIKKNQKIDAQSPDTQGRVIVSMIVEKDGSLTNIKVTRGLSTGYDIQAVQLVKQSPKWKPGINGGKPVRTLFLVVVDFKHDN